MEKDEEYRDPRQPGEESRTSLLEYSASDAESVEDIDCAIYSNGKQRSVGVQVTSGLFLKSPLGSTAFYDVITSGNSVFDLLPGLKTSSGTQLKDGVPPKLDTAMDPDSEQTFRGANKKAAMSNSESIFLHKTISPINYGSSQPELYKKNKHLNTVENIPKSASLQDKQRDDKIVTLDRVIPIDIHVQQDTKEPYIKENTELRIGDDGKIMLGEVPLTSKGDLKSFCETKKASSDSEIHDKFEIVTGLLRRRDNPEDMEGFPSNIPCKIFIPLLPFEEQIHGDEDLTVGIVLERSRHDIHRGSEPPQRATPAVLVPNRSSSHVNLDSESRQRLRPESPPVLSDLLHYHGTQSPAVDPRNKNANDQSDVTSLTSAHEAMGSPQTPPDLLSDTESNLEPHISSNVDTGLDEDIPHDIIIQHASAPAVAIESSSDPHHTGFEYDSGSSLNFSPLNSIAHELIQILISDDEDPLFFEDIPLNNLFRQTRAIGSSVRRTSYPVQESHLATLAEVMRRYSAPSYPQPEANSAYVIVSNDPIAQHHQRTALPVNPFSITEMSSHSTRGGVRSVRSGSQRTRIPSKDNTEPGAYPTRSVRPKEGGKKKEKTEKSLIARLKDYRYGVLNDYASLNTSFDTLILLNEWMREIATASVDHNAAATATCIFLWACRMFLQMLEDRLNECAYDQLHPLSITHMHIYQALGGAGFGGNAMKVSQFLIDSNVLSDVEYDWCFFVSCCIASSIKEELYKINRPNSSEKSLNQYDRLSNLFQPLMEALEAQVEDILDYSKQLEAENTQCTSEHEKRKRRKSPVNPVAVPRPHLPLNSLRNYATRFVSLVMERVGRDIKIACGDKDTCECFAAMKKPTTSRGHHNIPLTEAMSLNLLWELNTAVQKIK